MKNATKHADELKSFAKKLMKEHKPSASPEPMEPLNALVMASMLYDVTDARAEEAVKAIGQEFVDLNEFRVATDLEIQGLLGTRYPAIEQRVATVTMALNNIFEREHTLSLNRLKEVSKRDARQFLRDLPEVHPFVEAYVMLMAFEGTAMPVDDTILDYLKEHEIVEEETTIIEAQKFLENNLKAEEVGPFFHAIRAASLEAGKRKKAKA